MTARKSDLHAIVADLSAAGYCAADIARALNRSHERIRQLMRDLHLAKPRMRTIEDLPHDLRERVKMFRELDNASAGTIHTLG